MKISGVFGLIENGERGYNPQIQCVRVPYTITSGDDAQSLAVVHVEFPVPWPDLNYTVEFAVQHLGAPDTANDFLVGCFHSVTKFGVDVHITVIGTQVGEKIVLQCISIHD